jgi:site-specific recombinase XerD
MSAPRLLDQVRIAARLRRLSLRSEKAYVQQIKRFILFHGKKHPREMDAKHIRDCLSYLAVERNVSAPTKMSRSRLCSSCIVMFSNKNSIRIEDVERARTNRRMPVVLSKPEVNAILNHLTGIPYLAAALMYGSGLRLMECLRLRVKDIDFSYNQILVRSGKGDKDRVIRSYVFVERELKIVRAPF